VFPEKQIMGGVAYVATHIARPGVIHQTGSRRRRKRTVADVER